MCRSTVLALLLVVFLIFDYTGVANAYSSRPRVCIKDGCLRGTWLKDSVNSPYAAYFGIPYAKPPVNELRFANPQPAEPWDGEYDATLAKVPCIQKISVNPSFPIFGKEDCLYLNVYVPKQDYVPSDGPLPVMVYIHGGAYAYGSARPEELGPERFMSTRRVIVVTLQYRVGVLGFLSTGDRSASGNYGMKDQVQALRWVQRNIHTFGGNPRLVTLFGESAGGSSTQFHMLSPLSRGLFHRVISMSGSALSSWSIPTMDPLALARAQGRVVGIADADTISTGELVATLRRLNASDLILSLDRLKLWDIQPVVLYGPVVEPSDEPEPFLAEHPKALWRRGKYANVPWMTGCTPSDGSFVSQTVYRNSSLIADGNSKFTQLLPALLQTEISSAELNRLRQRFFSSLSSGDWITEANYGEITRLFSEVLFLYPMVRSIKQHLKNRKQTPTTVYSFQFHGRYSFSTVYTGSAKPYGLTHADELIYLFKIPMFFPEFPPRSPEAEMSLHWVKFIVDFATKKSADNKGTCTEAECGVVTYANSNNTMFPVKKTVESGLDEDMYAFWEQILEG